MSIDGLNAAQVAKTSVTANQAKAQAANSNSSQVNSVFDGSKKVEDKKTEHPQTMTSYEKDVWIRDYCQKNGVSKKDAKAAFKQQFSKIDGMSRKDAKIWLNNYMEQNGCSKKDAKAAFKEEFGYGVPASFGQKIAKALIPFGNISGLFSSELRRGAAEYIAKDQT